MNDTNLNTKMEKSNGVAKELISNLVLNGDISKMSAEMKVEYYNKLCHSLSLNPITRPFQLITFQGKTILYATKDATEQLRKLNGVSVVEMTQDFQKDLCITKCKVQDKHGRFDIATGAVSIVGLKADALANAIMKSETKGKRRATLSICGLGVLDESELETLPDYKTAQISQITNDEAEKITYEPIEDNPFILMASAKSLDEMKSIWSNHKSLQKDEKFKELKEKRKQELEGNVTVEDITEIHE